MNALRRISLLWGNAMTDREEHSNHHTTNKKARHDPCSCNKHRKQRSCRAIELHFINNGLPDDKYLSAPIPDRPLFPQTKYLSRERRRPLCLCLFLILLRFSLVLQTQFGFLLRLRGNLILARHCFSPPFKSIMKTFTHHSHSCVSSAHFIIRPHGQLEK